ncbi:branched-chain amino acid transport system ATP-binding protein [Arthrobacter sp. V1I7]|uniref:ABC transporter ATP-binding protein n=1 Tax=Arthrobacter sp. V1I7 TaxID=3042274 RepID=UPI00277E980D|nr:ABC transporter ATP-binding protein [Arthrobacter sp. V1I7]MDQ0823765.1 branched-chain amino acid transport system ATP-binding protein [Arthrobacter sp. V1I7]
MKASAEPTEPLLSVRDLHVYRGEAHVLHGVSFDVKPNRVTALLGRNGSGKTTTLLAILGILKAKGSIRIAGEETIGRSTDMLVREGIGFVPEDREVFTRLTVAENLRLAARSAESAERLRRVHELFPDLLKRSQQRAGSLSGGQQQMIAIARAMLNRNRLLLVDEPSKGLAPIVVTDMVAALENAATDSTVLLVEQNVRVAQRLATDAVVLDHGKVVFAGPMSELVADPEMTRLYLGVSGATRVSKLDVRTTNLSNG